MDATEPDILSNISIEDRKSLMTPTITGSPSKYFNTFSVVNASAIFDGQRKSDPDKRVFILTRSLCRNSAVCCSNMVVATLEQRWEENLNYKYPQVSTSLSQVHLTGTTDIGGFAVEKRYEKPTRPTLPNGEKLMTRWFQFGTFCVRYSEYTVNSRTRNVLTLRPKDILLSTPCFRLTN
jgi:alpha-D-xyloside xylohydrolase